MTPHDQLMSHLIALKRELEQYIDEFTPTSGALAMEFINQTLLVCHQFINYENDDSTNEAV